MCTVASNSQTGPIFVFVLFLSIRIIGVRKSGATKHYCPAVRCYITLRYGI